MNCPNCKTKMEGERCDFVLEEYGLGKFRHMPQYHYRCEDCDNEFVRTGMAKLRALTEADRYAEIRVVE